MVLFLIGYMGCGKSTIGRSLAKRMGYAFMDMDSEIERECGMTISEIFATHGETFFREKEASTLLEVGHRAENTIVATGGGVACFGNNMQTMRECGQTIYFKMSPSKLVQRLQHGRDKRPIIRGMDDQQLLAFIQDNLVRREPFYERAALVIDCNGVSDDYIVGHVEDYMANLNAK